MDEDTPDTRVQAVASVPVDAHVHFHALGRVAETLDAAAANFQAHGGRGSGCLGMLLLTQAAGERVYEKLSSQAAIGRWRISPALGEPQSVIAEHDAGWIAVVCGRQIRCEHGLEVAALGTTEQFADGKPFEETIARVQAVDGALAALPWGFGKWSGARGEKVRRALEGHSPRALVVGDNGGRMSLWGQPSMIRAASRAGFLVLPGTDPFPFGKDHRRVGAFGFFAATAASTDTPWGDLLRWLLAQRKSPQSYGQALPVLRFAINQIGIQLRNIGRRRTGR